MTKQEIAASAIIISRNYNEIATSISAKISDDLEKGNITFDHFLNIQEKVINPIIVQSTKMTIQIAKEVAKDIEDNFNKIKEGTERFKTEIKKISEIEKILNIAGLVLTSVALVATFIAAPNPISAVTAIGSIAQLISAIKPDKKE